MNNRLNGLFAGTAVLAVSALGGCGNDGAVMMTPEQEENRYHYLTNKDDYKDFYDFHTDTSTLKISYSNGYLKFEENDLKDFPLEKQQEYAALKAEHYGGPAYIPVDPKTGELVPLEATPQTNLQAVPPAP